jgi:TRAP-type uncharacterized transport system fused permease subunit
MPFLVPISALITVLVDESPKPEDVKAGWTAFAIFLLLAAAVVFLGFSLVKHLRRAQAAQDAGLYDGPATETGDQPGDRPADGTGEQPDTHTTP